MKRISRRFPDASRPEIIVFPETSRLEMRISGREPSGNRLEIVKMHCFRTLAHFRTASARKCDFRTASVHSYIP